MKNKVSKFNELYVVYGINADPDFHNRWLVAAFTSEDAAIDRVILLNKWLREAQASSFDPSPPKELDSETLYQASEIRSYGHRTVKLEG